MKKLVLALGILVLLLASACDGGEPVDTEETPAEETESPSPEPAAFQLQGRVIEAVITVRATPEPTPTASPTGTPAGTPSPDVTPTPTGTPTPTPTGGETTPTPGGVVEQATPGSLSIRLTSYSGEGTSCQFGEDDTVVVAFTRATQFTPTELGTSDRFPRNLRETNVNVEGTVVDEERCILAAESVATQVPGATPTPTGATPTPATGTTPTPTPGESPSPAASPTESPG